MFDYDKKFNLSQIGDAYKLKDARNFVRFDNRKQLEKFLNKKYDDEDTKKIEREKYFNFIYYARTVTGISFFKDEYTYVEDPYFDYDNLVSMNEFPGMVASEILDTLEMIYEDGYYLHISPNEFRRYIRDESGPLLSDVNKSALLYAFEVVFLLVFGFSKGLFKDRYSDSELEDESEFEDEHVDDSLFHITDSDDSSDESSFSDDDNNSFNDNNSSNDSSKIDLILSEKMDRLLNKLDE